MLRLLLIAGIAVLAWRVLTGRWPWEHFAGRRLSDPGARDRDHARVLLGVREGAGREEILEAHKKLVAVVHPDRGGTNEAVHEANNARDLLLADAAQRKTEHP